MPNTFEIAECSKYCNLCLRLVQLCILFFSKNIFCLDSSRVQAVLREIVAAAHGESSAELQIEKHLNSAFYGQETRGKKRPVEPLVVGNENPKYGDPQQNPETGMPWSPNIPYDSSTETWVCPFCHHRYRAKLSIQIHIKLIHFQEDIGDYNLSVELHSPTVRKSNEIQCQWDEFYGEFPPPDSFSQVQSQQGLQWQSEMEDFRQQKTEFAMRNVVGNNRPDQSISYIMNERFGFQDDIDTRIPCGTSSAGNRKRPRMASIKCPHCSKVLSSQRSFETHLRLHSGDKPFQCANCQARFASVQGLAVHSGSQKCTRETRKPHAPVSAAAVVKDSKRFCEAVAQEDVGRYQNMTPKISENSGKDLSMRKEDALKVYDFDDETEQPGSKSLQHSVDFAEAQEFGSALKEGNRANLLRPASKYSEHREQFGSSPTPQQTHEAEEPSQDINCPQQLPGPEYFAQHETSLQSPNGLFNDTQKSSNDSLNVPYAENLNESTEASSQDPSDSCPVDPSERPPESQASSYAQYEENTDHSSKEFMEMGLKHEAEDMTMDLPDINLLFPDITFIEAPESDSVQMNPEQPWEVPVTWEELHLAPVSSMEAEYAATALETGLIAVLQNRFCANDEDENLSFEIRLV